jgi:hypothetical protein
MLTDKDIRRMQMLYWKHFGIELDKDEARMKLSLLVRQLELVYVPITAEQLQAYRDATGQTASEDGNNELSSGE